MTRHAGRGSLSAGGRRFARDTGPKPLSDTPEAPQARKVITPKPGFVDEVEAASERLLGQRPDEILAPGGSFRASVRVVLGERTAILTRRETTGRGQLEAECLKRLSERGAPVPRLLGYDGTWLAQEDVPGLRLSIALAECTADERRMLVDMAVESLFRISDAAARSSLAGVAPPLGAGRDWVERVVRRPGRLGGRLGVKLPAWDAEACLERLMVPCASFVKWDARPANAIVHPEGRVVWFDWEHAGCREGVEDFAWMSADEYFSAEVDDVAAAVRRGLEQDDAKTAESRMDYLAVFATMHAAVRLELIIERHGEVGWRDPQEVLRRDSVGASQPNAARLLRNARNWSERSPLTAPLSGWFADVSAKVVAL